MVFVVSYKRVGHWSEESGIRALDKERGRCCVPRARDRHVTEWFSPREILY